jgi:DNA-binding response OmpR family regulator
MVDPTMANPRIVLLVDDDTDTRRIYERLLTHEGYQVLEARTGDEAIAIARAAAPGIVVLDLGLPDMDGLDVSRALRANQAATCLRIVVLTAYVSDADRARVLAAGCDVYVAKPILPRALVAIIQQLDTASTPPRPPESLEPIPRRSPSAHSAAA